MNVFIVNLKQSADRRKKMEAQLNTLNIAYEFIEAVNGKDLSSEALNAATHNTNYAFLPGEIGCALSHQNIYKKMVQENIDSALILEDDVTLAGDLPNILENIEFLSDAPSVILLSRVNKYYDKPVKNITGDYFLHKTQHATTTHSYIINRSGAKSLLSNLFPIWITADKWSLFEDLSLISVHSVIPFPVQLSEDANISTINAVKGDGAINSQKREIWGELMKKRPLLAKIKHRYRRAITPIFHKIVNQGKG